MNCAIVNWNALRFLLSVQSIQVKPGQLHVFWSPYARMTSASLPRGTYFIVRIRVEFLPATFARFNVYGVPELTDGRQNASVWRLCASSIYYLFWPACFYSPHASRRSPRLDWVGVGTARASEPAGTPVTSPVTPVRKPLRNPPHKPLGAPFGRHKARMSFW